MTNIYKIHAYDSMCEYFYAVFINFMLKEKSLLNYTNLFSPNDYEKNDKIIEKVFLWTDFKKVRVRKIYCTRCEKCKEF